MAKYFVSVEQMRQIEWARSWNWAVLFPSAPAPFNSWFPATSVDEGIFNVEKMDFTAGLGNFAIPKSTSMFELKISLVDGGNPQSGAVKLVLHDWIRQWGKDIVSLNQWYVKTLSEICKECQVVHYDSTESWVEINRYMVFPYGNYSYRGESPGETVTLDLDLVVAAVIGDGYSSAREAASEVVNTIVRGVTNLINHKNPPLSGLELRR